ncbi:MAG: glycosyltransferase [Phycisphaerae bacterium]|nr:glycosyltransferase [Phycisphaerae bacterium]MDW8263365.1 glycosyltransferase [Phycisphaerales bacterium]
MHVLYVHQNFPAQFGHIAHHLVKKLGWKCTYVSETPGGNVGGIDKIQYKVQGGATRQNHFCSRTFENTVWHCDAVYQALKKRPDIRPDLIVGHSGFGSTLFLRELYPEVPVINFFEYYYVPHDPESDMDFRRDLGWQVPEVKYLRSYCRNAMILLDLQNCQLGYTPTRFQFSKFPANYHSKLRVIFDGVDRAIYHGHEEALRPPVAQRGDRVVCGVQVPSDYRIISYCSRGFESMRGFDIFLRAAKFITQRYKKVKVIVVGTDRIAYGGDEQYLNGYKSFRDWTIAREQPIDLSNIVFVGRQDPRELARLLAMTDLHIYLTVPFVLSWSLMDALSCGATVLASNTAPVREMIRDGENGLLADFFSPEEFAEKAVRVLENPDEFRPLGRAAEQMICEKYSLEAVLPQMLAMYEEARRMDTGVRKAAPMPTTPAIPPPPPPPVVTGPAPVSLHSIAQSAATGIGQKRSPFRG